MFVALLPPVSLRFLGLNWVGGRFLERGAEIACDEMNEACDWEKRRLFELYICLNQYPSCSLRRNVDRWRGF